MTKGIILAGGSGSRLFPLTLATSKQLLAVYNKPMIYYPLSTLMLAGIRDILIITTPDDLPRFRQLLGNGSQLGLSVSYAEQPNPDGLPHAFIIGRRFIGPDPVALILGDNIFYGDGMGGLLLETVADRAGGTVFAYAVSDPARYGIVEFDKSGRAVGIEEKPTHPKSRFAVTGLYFFDNRVVEIAPGLTPSARGELEITDIIRAYLREQSLQVKVLGRGFAWLDAGTPETLLQANHFVAAIEQRQGLKIGAIEEIAYHMKFIESEQLERLARAANGSAYGAYLLDVLQQPTRQ